MCYWKLCKVYLSAVRKTFQKVRKGQTQNNIYLPRFIDRIRLTNASLDTHVNNLSRNIYNYIIHLYNTFIIHNYTFIYIINIVTPPLIPFSYKSIMLISIIKSNTNSITNSIQLSVTKK